MQINGMWHDGNNHATNILDSSLKVAIKYGNAEWNKNRRKENIEKKKQKKIFWILKMRFLWARRRYRTRSETMWTKRRKTLRDVTFFFHELTLVFGLRCRFHLCRQYKICRILYVAVRTVGTLPLTRRIQSLYSKLLFFFANHFYRVALSYEFGVLFLCFFDIKDVLQRE